MDCVFGPSDKFEFLKKGLDLIDDNIIDKLHLIIKSVVIKLPLEFDDIIKQTIKEQTLKASKVNIIDRNLLIYTNNSWKNYKYDNIPLNFNNNQLISNNQANLNFYTDNVTCIVFSVQ